MVVSHPSHETTACPSLDLRRTQPYSSSNRASSSEPFTDYTPFAAIESTSIGIILSRRLDGNRGLRQVLEIDSTEGCISGPDDNLDRTRTLRWWHHDNELRVICRLDLCVDCIEAHA